MRYVLAIVLPPFAILSCGKPVQFVLNLIFWLASLALLLCGIVMIVLLPILGGLAFVGWLFCTIHAIVVCTSRSRDKQMDRLVNAIQARPVAQQP